MSTSAFKERLLHKGLLKAGDVIVADRNSASPSYWLMERDEVDDDWKRADKNAVWIGGGVPNGFQHDNPRVTSWDSLTVEDQKAKVFRVDYWPDHVCIMVAKWRLTQ